MTEQVVDRDGLGVVIGFGEILHHLGSVVHVQLGGLLAVVGGDDQFLVQAPGAALPPAVSLLDTIAVGVVPLRELRRELLPDGGR